MKVNIGEQSDQEKKGIEYVYDNYRPQRKDSNYGSYNSYSSYYNRNQRDNRWVFQIIISGLILLIVAVLFRLDIPFSGPVKNTIKYLMNTETNVQPVFSKIVQLASQQGNLEWPMMDDIPSQIVPVDSPVPEEYTLSLPVSGNVSQVYGWSVVPGEKIQVFHQGLDIEVPVGTEVKAAAKGRVLKFGEDEKLGHYVLIGNSDGRMIRYANLSEVLVEDDQVVNAGDIVGKTGEFERKSAHLHFEIIVDGKPVDPLSKLGIDTSGIKAGADTKKSQ